MSTRQRTTPAVNGGNGRNGRQNRRQAAERTPADEYRRARTLLVKGIPTEMNNSATYRLLFNEEARPYLSLTPATSRLRKVRVVQGDRMATYKSLFIEVDTEETAAEFRRRWEGLSVEFLGGQALWVEEAAQAIAGGHPADYDPATRRPCLFGLNDDGILLANFYYNFSQADFSPAPAPASASASASAQHTGRPS